MISRDSVFNGEIPLATNKANKFLTLKNVQLMLYDIKNVSRTVCVSILLFYLDDLSATSRRVSD